MTARICVLGGGVVGLSIAHDVARAGHAVTVVADRSAAESVSAVAAALWFPYRSGTSPSAARWLARSLVRFEELAADRSTGVDLRSGLVVERRTDPDRSWTAAVPGHREARPDELIAGAVSGVRATLPVISMPTYLPWLEVRCRDLGVHLVRRTVGAVDELAGEADLVVVAAGIRSGELLQDGSVFPVRGQTVLVANPGISDWVVDEDHPEGLTYVVPRRDGVVCGGIAEVGSWDTGIDADTERGIQQRAAALVPSLSGLPVLSAQAGLRPARDAVRLEVVDGHAVPVIACYGHGGAGVTLSWGCAEAVVELVAAAV